MVRTLLFRVDKLADCVVDFLAVRDVLDFDTADGPALSDSGCRRGEINSAQAVPSLDDASAEICFGDASVVNCLVLCSPEALGVFETVRIEFVFCFVIGSFFRNVCEDRDAEEKEQAEENECAPAGQRQVQGLYAEH